MKAVHILSIAIFVLLTSCQNKPDGQSVKASDPVGVAAESTMEAEQYEITTGQINWTASKPTAQHLGTVDLAGGSLSVKGNQILSGSFSVDLTSIENIDLTKAEDKNKLEGHLKSADFFDVDNHPQASFVITSSEQKNDQPMVTHHITGDLTIKGISKSVTIPANVSFVGNKLLAATPAFTIDRTEWDIKYNSGLLGTAADQIISDEISLVITFEAKKA